MADAEVSSRPYVATYGRRQQRREETPLSDVEGQPSQPSPRPRDALFLDSSPVHNGGASRRSRNATNDDETGNTSASSSDDARQATSKSRSTAGGAARTRPELSRLISDDSDDDDDDNAGSQNALDRIRAQLRGPTSSGSSGSRRDATSSLSSAPSLSQPSRAGKGIPGLSDSEDDEADRTMTSRPSRVGLLAGRMKARITTTSSNDGPSRSLPSQRSASPRRSFTLSDDDDSASSLSDSAPDSQVEQSRKDRLAATQRKHKLEQMAAKRRQATAAAEPEVEVSLEDDFFNQADEDAPATDDPIRSSSTAGHDDDSDEDLPDAREVARRAAARGQQPGGKASGSRDKHKSSSKSQKAAKAPKGPKPLSKKEQEEMRKMQAKIERSRPMPSLALQSHPVDRQEYSIAQLAAKFKQQPQAEASPESDDPIEVDTPRRPAAVASAAKNKPSLPSPASLLPQTGRSSDSVVVSNAEDAKRRKAQEALRLRKQKWLQSQEENAQRPFMSAATADSIESQGSDDLVFDLAGPSRNGKDDDDDLILVDTPKGASGSKGKVASRLFAGKLQERSTNGGAAKSKGPPARNNSRQAPAGMSTTDFKQSMLDKIKRQNISIRAAREQQAGPRAAQQQAPPTASTTSELTDESSADALKRIGERAKGQPDAEDEVDEDGDAGSEDEDFAPEGSGSEEEEQEEEIEESGAKAAAGSEEDEDPLEDEEDVMPPSSQNTNRSLGRTGMENDDSDDDEEEELHTARPSKKRAQRVVADEEDEEELQRQQHEQEQESDAAAAAAAGPSSTSRPSAHSFGGPAGLTQFFQDTQASPAAVDDEPNHSQSESQKLIAAEAAAAAAAGAGGKPSSTFAGPRPTNDSVLGQFFADTQLSQSPRGQSLDVIGATGRARNADHFAFAMGESSGSGVGGDALSQFFNEGTQVGTREAAGGEQAPQPFAVGSMGPPTAIPADGFAALRRQAQGDGQDLLGSPDSVLPTPEFSGDEQGLDSHLKTPQSVSAAAAPKQYLNHEGFFTQTRPVAPAPESAGGARSAQGGDSFGANASQWAGESSSQLQQHQPDGDGESYQEPSSPSADTARRKRFRRAAMPDEEDSEEEEVEQQHEDEEEEEEEDDGDSRGSASDVDDHNHDHHDDAAADSDASDAEDDDVHPGATANAWEVLKRAAQRADQAKAAHQPKDKKKRRHQYIEGEAEESEDEEVGGPTRKAGGLKGVFDASDDEGNDDSDSEDDGADLEGLVDDVKERDEAAKDKLALARYQQDLDVDEAAALALAEKAAKGELRGKRRKGRDGQGGLEDLLDDDFDEERLKRMASRPKGWVSKRRKLEGGDGMDLLASKAESRAFVEGYAETHQSNVGGDEYSFLAGAEDEGDDDSDEDEDDEDEEERDAAAAHDDRPDDDLDELDRVFAQRITRKELAKELQERRRKRRRLGQLASDDEDEEEERQQQQEKASMPPASRDFFATDESDNEDDDGRAGASFRRNGAASKAKALPSYLHDRINSSSSRPSASTNGKRTHSRPHESDEDEDEDHDASADPALALVEGLKRRRAVSPRTAARLAKVAAEYGDRNEAYTGAQGGGGGGGGSSITSFGARAARQQSGGGVDRQKAGAGAFAQAKAGGAAEREGRRPMGMSSSASSGLLAKRVVEESQ